MRELCSHEVYLHSILIAFCEGCTFIVRIDYLWLLRWWPQCLQYADFQTSWPVIGEKPEQPHPTVPLQWAPWTGTWVWRSAVVVLGELLAVVNELRPITATTAIAIPAKNFFVFIIVCAKFVSHPTFCYVEIVVCLTIYDGHQAKVTNHLLFLITLNKRVTVPIIPVTILSVVLIIAVPYFDASTLINVTIGVVIWRCISFASKRNVVNNNLSMSSTRTTNQCSVACASRTYLWNITAVVWIINGNLSISTAWWACYGSMTLTTSTFLNRLCIY